MKLIITVLIFVTTLFGNDQCRDMIEVFPEIRADLYDAMEERTFYLINIHKLTNPKLKEDEMLKIVANELNDRCRKVTLYALDRVMVNKDRLQMVLEFWSNGNESSKYELDRLRRLYPAN